MSAEATPVIDIAAIFGLLFIRQPELTEGSPLLCNMTQMMDLLHRECAGTSIKETLEQTHSLFGHTHTLALGSVCCCHLSFGSISVAVPNLPAYYFTRPRPGR